MVLNNYWQYLYAIATTEVGNVCSDVLLRDMQYGSNNGLTIQAADVNFRLSLLGVVGSGDTAPTANDYQLESQLNLTNMATVVSNYHQDDNFKSIVTITGTNTNNYSVTIKEVGIYKRITNNMLTVMSFLLVRHVLDQPITVPSNEGFTVSIEWTEQ